VVDRLLVTVFDGGEALGEETSFLLEFRVCFRTGIFMVTIVQNPVIHVFALDVLHHEEDVGGGFEGAMERDDVWMSEGGVDEYFFSTVLDLSLVQSGLVDGLDGEKLLGGERGVIRRGVLGQVYSCIGAVAQDIQQQKRCSGIGIDNGCVDSKSHRMRLHYRLNLIQSVSNGGVVARKAELCSKEFRGCVVSLGGNSGCDGRTGV